MRRLDTARLAPLALAVALLSLLLNGVLLWQIRHPERWVAPVLHRLSSGLADPDGVIRHEVRIPEGTPINLDIPVDERFHIAVDTVIPVNTTVRIPLRLPMGTRVVSVPIRADVPLRTQLPLDVRHTFRLRTRTTRALVVPIQLRVDELLR